MIRCLRCQLPVFASYVTVVAIVVIITFMPSTAESTVLTKRTVMTGVYSGTFSSPGYPKSYPVNVAYTWIFPKYEHDVVLINVVDMNLYLCYVVDLDENCNLYDHVAVEGHLPFCNWRMPKGLITLTERTVIKFRSFPSREACRGRGFNASFKVVSRIIHVKTTLRSPNHPTISSTTEGDKANENSSRTVIIVIVVVLIAFSVMFLILCVWCCKRKKRQRFDRRDGERTRSYSSVPAQDGNRSSDPQTHRNDVVSYSELLRNEDQGVPMAQGPPPTYDSVVNPENTLQRESDNNGEAEFENPPSYETALRERQTQRERRNAGRRTASRTPHRREQRIAQETSDQSPSNNSPQRTNDNETNESGNQSPPNSSTQTAQASDQSNSVENALESPTDSPEAGSLNVVASETSGDSCPDDSRREVFV